MLTKLELALEHMIGRAQVKNPALMTTEHAYNCTRAFRDAFRAVHPDWHEALREIDALVLKLAPGTRPVGDAEYPKRRFKRQRKPRMPSAKKQSVLLLMTNPIYANKTRRLPSDLYAEYKPEDDPNGVFGTILVHAAALEMMMATNFSPAEVANLQVPDVDEERLVLRSASGEFEAVGQTRHILETYIRKIRAFRPGHASTALFPGKKGRGYHPNALAQAVRRLVADGTGHPISAKDLRAAVCVMHALGAGASDATIQRFLDRKQTDDDPLINWIRFLKTQT